MPKPTRFLTTDILITDMTVQLGERGRDPLYEIMDKYGMKPGGKIKVTKEQFDADFVPFVGQPTDDYPDGRPVIPFPGGSSLNTFVTMGKVLDGLVDMKFLGVLGGGPNSQNIRRVLGEAGIGVIPESFPARYDGEGRIVTPTSAVSYVFRLPSGERSIATYPGTARQIMTPDDIKWEMITGTDKMFMQGFLADKIEPAVIDKMMHLRQEAAKQGHYVELLQALPTTAFHDASRSERFKFIVPSAALVLCNDEELGAIFNVKPERAAESLQEFFCQEHPGAIVKGERVGFVTKGAAGADVVTADKITHVPARKVDPNDIVSTLGSGDTSFAFYLIGRELGLNPVECAKLAMEGAAEKITTSRSARLRDPVATLEKIRPSLAEEVSRRSEAAKSEVELY